MCNKHYLQLPIRIKGAVVKRPVVKAATVVAAAKPKKAVVVKRVPVPEGVTEGTVVLMIGCTYGYTLDPILLPLCDGSSLPTTLMVPFTSKIASLTSLKSFMLCSRKAV